MMKFKKIIPALRRRVVQFQQDERIRSIAKKIAQEPLKDHEAPVVFFNASTRISAISLNAGFSLLASWAVRKRGIPVIYFVCDAGLSRCVLGTNAVDPSQNMPCDSCRAQSKACYPDSATRKYRYQLDNELEKQIHDLDVDSLGKFQFRDVELGKLVLPTMRWVLRRHHLLDDEPTRYLYRQFILSAWNVKLKFEALLDGTTPQAVVVFNGMFFPEAMVRQICLGRGIRVITHEVGLLPFTGYFTEGEATAYPIDIPADFEMNDRQNERLDQYLSNRFQGNFSMAGVQFWPEIRPLPQEYLEKIKSFKQVVPVFTNVVFDTSQGHANTLFDNMFEWLDEILPYIERNPETLFVIRAHPDELRPGKQSRESVKDWAVRRKITDYPNVIFFNATDFVSSYEWVQLSKFVMVYNSTIGLEASILGKAVLCAGKARFTQVDSVFLPKDKAAYFEMFELFLKSTGAKPPIQHAKNARKFLYYQLFCTSLPFDTFLEEDRERRGYVQFKHFAFEMLNPENSQTIQVLLDGILEKKSFLLEP